MDIWWLLGFLGYVLGSLLIGLSATAVHWNIVDEVNAKLDEKERFELLGWGPGKTGRLLREYRRLYPDGRSFFHLRILGTAAVTLVSTVAWSLGFPAVLLAFVALIGFSVIWMMGRI